MRLANPLLICKTARAGDPHSISRLRPPFRAGGARLRESSRGSGYHRLNEMADRAALEREMEEIRAQLDWVRGYL